MFGKESFMALKSIFPLILLLVYALAPGVALANPDELANPEVFAGTGPDVCNFTDSKNQAWSRVGNSSNTSNGFEGLCLAEAIQKDRFQFFYYKGVLQPIALGPEFKQNELYAFEEGLQALTETGALREIPGSQFSLRRSLELFHRFFAHTLAPVSGDELSNFFSPAEIKELAQLIELSGPMLVSSGETQTGLGVSPSVILSQTVARVIDRSSDREILTTLKDGVISFYLSQAGQLALLKQTKLMNSGKILKIEGKINKYRVRDALFHSSKVAYSWCWDSTTPYHKMDVGLPPGAWGAFLIYIGTPITAIPCGVLPGVPFVAGVVATPIEFGAHLMDQGLNSDAVAARKFKRLVRGRTVRASSAVFDSLLRQIEKLN
jgi:hypothetical protein